ncbi:MAG TPA: hypothetical protein VFA04_13010 [Bryobacteraceae bacterium]|nr:hypothetical protein [Bryobacteraceae bacterium]
MVVAPATARRREDFLTVPLMMLAGTALVLGLTLEVLTPSGELHWSAAASARTVAGNMVMRTPGGPVKKQVTSASERAGLVHFTVRTAGVRVVIRRTDIPNAPEQTVTDRSMHLPAGHWVANATAPGFRNWMTYFAVRPDAPTNLLIRLKPNVTTSGHRQKRRSTVRFTESAQG